MSREDNRREALRLKMERRPLGVSGRIARAFLDSKLTPLLVVASLLLGAFGLLVTPREEEPQIKVPMIDVFLAMPGASAAEVERRLASPVEKALYEIENVEYVYSTSQPSGGMVIVRFRVGSDPDVAVTRVHAKVAELIPSLPPGALPPSVAPRSIDDVPVLAYTLFPGGAFPASSLELRQTAEELKAHLDRHPRVARVTILGGERRVVAVKLDRDRMAAYHVSPLQVHQSLSSLNWRLPAGAFSSRDSDVEVEVGNFFRSAEEVRSAVVGVYGGRPVYLRDVAVVADGPDEPADFVWIMAPGIDAPAVTVAVAKKPGTNAVKLVEELDALVGALRGPVIAGNVQVKKTRDYGFTAGEKSSELIKHLWFATFAVVVLMAFALGRREAIVVLVAVPATL
ncbi:MAG TPA: efflux RND transporter permease subunit, partial [Thermoanaerobaculia bacterium]